MSSMNRRDFLTAAAATTAGLATTATLSASRQNESSGGKTFQLKYAPHFGMLRNLGGDDPVDQLAFAASEGFRAWEDNGMMGRGEDEQARLAEAMKEHDIEMGVFVANAEWGEPRYVSGKAEDVKFLVGEAEKAVACAKRVNAKWATVVPGPYVNNREWDYQTANCVKALREMAAVCEDGDLVMVLEPLNHWANHPGMFLSKIPQAKLICDAVNSPSCKILDDLYHQQIQEGNLIPNMDMAWDQIAYIQVGDNPGRQEPTTGEINYKNVFRHLKRKGFEGIVGMEHGVSGRGAEGERRLIEAYREVDSFEA